MGWWDNRSREKTGAQDDLWFLAWNLGDKGVIQAAQEEDMIRRTDEQVRCLRTAGDNI